MQDVTFTEGHTSAHDEDEKDIEVNETLIQYATSTMDEQEQEDVEEEEEALPLGNIPIRFQKVID